MTNTIPELAAPKGLDTWSIGPSVAGFVKGLWGGGPGGSISLGGYYNTDTQRFGSFVTVGIGGGSDRSAAIAGSWTSGGLDKFLGTGGSVYAAVPTPIGRVSIGASQDTETGKLASVQAAYGVGQPVGFGIQKTVTLDTTAMTLAAMAGPDNPALDDVLNAGAGQGVPQGQLKYVLGTNGLPLSSQSGSNNGGPGAEGVVCVKKSC